MSARSTARVPRKPMSIDFPPDLRERIERAASADDRKPSALVRMLVVRGLDQLSARKNAS